MRTRLAGRVGVAVATTCFLSLISTGAIWQAKCLLSSMQKSRMEKTNNQTLLSAQPRFHQNAAEIQAYDAVNHLLPLELEEPVRLEMTECLNELLADTITLCDLYKKSRWQVAGPTFYELHLLFDKHNELLTWFLSEHVVNVPLAEA
jgi:hypothetical protein